MSDPIQVKDILAEKSESLKITDSSYNKSYNKESKKSSYVKKGGNGGVRVGAGRPLGRRANHTITAQQAKARFIERVNKHVDDLFDAQLDLAKGEKVLMVKITERDDDGKIRKIYHEVVSDPLIIQQYMNNEDGYNAEFENINSDEEYYYITVKPSNNQAIQGMLDRAFGRAPEKIEVEGGFFKVDQLNIQIIQPEKLDSGKDEPTDIIEVESETGPSAQSS